MTLLLDVGVAVCAAALVLWLSAGLAVSALIALAAFAVVGIASLGGWLHARRRRPREAQRR